MACAPFDLLSIFRNPMHQYLAICCPHHPRVHLVAQHVSRFFSGVRSSNLARDGASLASSVDRYLFFRLSPRRSEGALQTTAFFITRVSVVSASATALRAITQMFPPSSFHLFRYSFPSIALLVSVCAKLSRLGSMRCATNGVNCAYVSIHHTIPPSITVFKPALFLCTGRTYTELSQVRTDVCPHFLPIDPVPSVLRMLTHSAGAVAFVEVVWALLGGEG